MAGEALPLLLSPLSKYTVIMDRIERLSCTSLTANKACLYAVDALLRLLGNVDKPFGSKPFIGVGEFC